MKVQKIKKSWIVANSYRIDAPIHLSDGVITKLLLESCPYEKTTLLAESKELYKGNIHRRVYVDSPEYGYPFMTASDMFKVDLNCDKFVSKKYSPYVNELTLKKDWIVITRSGTLGKVLYTNADFEGKFGTDDLIRINPSEKQVKRGFLYAYLKSRFGYALLTQSGYGGVVKHIEPEHIKNLPIPVFPEKKQQEINELIVEASDLRLKANKLLREGNSYFENLLDSDLNIPSEAIINSKKIPLYQNRFDASFNIHHEYLRNTVINSGLSFIKLSQYEKRIFIPNRGKRNYVDNGLQYISKSDISTFNPVRVEKYLSMRMKGIETLKVKENWILIARSGQEILGSTFYVGRKLNNLGVNEHALRLVVDKKNSHYIYAFLSSSFGKRYLRTGIFGSAILTINDDFLREILIPEFDITIKNRIICLVKESIKFTDNAMDLENQAISIIETEIDSWQN